MVKALSALFILVFSISLAWSQGCVEEIEQKLKSNTQSAADDFERISTLNSLASYYLDYCNDLEQFDELHEMAIGIAEMTYDDELIVFALSNYLDGIEKNYNHDELKNRIERLNRITEKLGNEVEIYESQIVGATAAIKAIRIDKEMGGLAQQLSLKAQNYAIQSKNDEGLLESGILLAKALLYQDKISESYQQMLFVKSMIQSLDTEKQKEYWTYRLNGTLSSFFYMTNDWDEAGAYKSKQLDYLGAQPEVDTLEIMWNKYDLVVISRRADRLSDTRMIKDILSYAETNNNEKLKSWVLAPYRNHLISEQMYDDLKELYIENYPDELEKLREGQPILYCMIMGSICEEESVDSSFHYYNRAESILTTISEKNYASRQYRRLGDINLRHNNTEKALDFYKKSYELAKAAGNKTFMLESLQALEALALKNQDFKLAYEYAQLKEGHLSELNNWVQKKSLMRMAFNNEGLITQLKAQGKYEDKKERHSRQNWLIAIMLALVFFVMLIMARMAVSEWVIEMMSFFTILCIFEFVILTIDHELHYATDGAPLPMFGAKVLLLSVLFPLHHIIERSVVNYMKKQKRLKNPDEGVITVIKKSTKNVVQSLWPWLSSESDGEKE